MRAIHHASRHDLDVSECAAAGPLRGRALRRGPLAARVRALLGEDGPRYPDLSEIAGRLCVSVRTLKRKLQHQGWRYRSLLDEVRCRDAQRLLTETRLTVEEVAVHVGYSTAANFSRAFRRWTGRSPGSFRRSSLSADFQRQAPSKGLVVCR